MTPTTTLTLDADPYPYTLHPAATAFVVIDLQRDLVEPGGSPTAPAPVRHLPRRHRPADRRPVQRSGGDTT